MKLSPLFLGCLTSLLLLPAHAGLVAHWPLDTDAMDATGNGHDGIIDGNTVSFGATGANNSTGSAATFSGNGHIDIPYSELLNPGVKAPDGSGSFTVALWVRPTRVGGAHRSPFTSREDNGANVNGPILYIEPSGQWSFWAGNNGPSGTWNAIPAGPATADAWVHVAIVYDSETITRKMYLDGVEVINQPGGISANSNRPTHIGGGADDGNSFTWAGDIDDVGIWDNPLTEEEVQNVMANGVDAGPVVPDPRLRIASPVILPLNGGVQQFPLTVNNVGLTKTLTISGTEFSGVNAGNFSVVTVPGPIAPGGAGTLTIAFDPQGSGGDIEAVLQITSNDSTEPVRSVVLRGSIHDPQVVAPAALDFGTLPAGTGPVTAAFNLQNAGGSRILSVTEVLVTGPQAANFTVTEFPATLAPGASGTITVTFDRLDGDGLIAALLKVTTDDPITPEVIVLTKALVSFTDPLVAWWPLDQDALDASGNGHDGTIFGDILFGEEGANAATGASASFDGSSRIDVLYDPRLNPGLSLPGESGSFTVTLWAFPTVVGDGNYHSPFTSREDNGASVNGPILYNTFNGRWEYWAGDHGPSGSWNPIDGGAVVADTWVHVAINYDAEAKTRRMYLDGVEVASQEVGVAANSIKDLHIGAGQDDGRAFYWVGRIDDVAFFRKALSASEVQQVMTGGANSLVSQPPDSPVITGFSGGPGVGTFTLTWVSTAGKSYRVQRSTNLSAWTNLDPAIPSGGVTTTFTDNTLPAGERSVFYRVELLP